MADEYGEERRGGCGYTEVTCSHCGGLGCTYCGRRGRVEVRAPAERCPHCEGDGCIYCGFTGWAHPKGKYDED